MAIENNILTISFPTAVDLSAAQHRVVDLSSGNAVQANAVAGVGILQNKPDGSASGEQITTASVMVQGVSQGISGAAYAEGAKLTADANGKLVTAGAGAASCGIALEAAGAADETHPVLLTPGGQAA